MDLLTEYRRELKGVVALPAKMEKNLLEHARSIRVLIEEEQQKPNPNNALIATLCDAARLGDEIIVASELDGPEDDDVEDVDAEEIEEAEPLDGAADQ